MSPKQMTKLLNGFGGQRVPPMALLAIYIYLDDELKAGRLFSNPAKGTTFEQNEKYLNNLFILATGSLVSKPDSDKYNVREAHGAAFHLMHLATLQYAGNEIAGIEVPRDVMIFKTSKAFDDRDPQKGALKFGRDVDILIADGDKEVWVETKSWAGIIKGKRPNTTATDKPYVFKAWQWGTGAREDADTAKTENLEGSHSLKQFSQDRIANKIGALVQGDRLSSTLNVKVANIQWQYQKFKVKSKAKKTKGKVLAMSPDLSLLRDEFKKVPSGGSSGLKRGHMGSATPPIAKIDMGALSVLLGYIQGELKDAIEEERLDLGYE